MNPTKIAACTLALALAATISGTAFAANYGGWAVKPSGQTYGSNLIVPAASDHRQMTGRKFRRGNRHRFRRGHRFRHRRRSFAFVFPYYYPYYGYRHYHRYDSAYVPPPAYAPPAQPAPASAQPAEPEPAPTPGESSYCREIIMEVVIDGVEQTAYGTTCRQPDGSWKITH